MAFEIENGVLKNYTEEQGVTEVVIPDSVTSIGDYAFRECSSLESITIPDSVKIIGCGAFYDCSSLKSVTIPNSVTRIEWEVFSGCSSLKSVTIPDSVTDIESYEVDSCGGTFYHCENLKAIEVSENNKDYASFDGVLYDKEITEMFYCPEGKEEITIPDSVTSIEEYAFYRCESLKSVTIPDSVKIFDSAFDFCEELTSITFYSTQFKELKLKIHFYWRDYIVKDDRHEDYYWGVYDFDEFFMRLHYLSCDDKKEEAREYLLRHLFVNESELNVMLLKEVIANENVAFIHHISKTGDFLTKENIDELIEYAREKNQLEISVILMN